MPYLFICLLLWNASLCALLDLEQETNSFILESKTVEIPGFPKAFNPSIVRWRGSILMSFRDHEFGRTPLNKLGLVFLDDTLNLVGQVHLLDLETEPDTRHNDIRLITIGDELYLVFNRLAGRFRKMCLAKLKYDGVNFSVQEPCLLSPPIEKKRDEKNWVPFDYEGSLLLAYSLSPHLILQPLLGNCKTYANTQERIPWKWGEMRGGTPALLDGEHYLAFFHSSLPLASMQSDGKKVLHYFMGAYIFPSTPPFSIIRMSPHPIIGKGFYQGDLRARWRDMRVIFPSGLLIDDPFVWVAMGHQDRAIWLVKMDKKGLLESLIPPQNLNL